MHKSGQYDVVIMGSGLGGLLCGALLSKQGLQVCIVEKNKQLGGNLQTFSRDRQVLDTGVHYIGGLEKGQNLYQVFKYAGIMDRLRLEKMDEDFDRILISGDEKKYVQSQGYDAFIKNLSESFPEEKINIEKYCDVVRKTCASYPLYNLTLQTNGEQYQGNHQSAKEVIASITQNETLQAVLAGNNLLYAGVGDKTPFHVHALIVNSYIESSWKCIGGGSQIAKALAFIIRKHGGDIVRNCEVTKIIEQNGRVTHAETATGQQFKGKYFISNINPSHTLAITASSFIKNIYRNRIVHLPQSIGSFSLHLIVKEKTIDYQKHNYYYHKKGCIWNLNNYNKDNWPLGYGLYYIGDSRNRGYAASISVLTPMRFSDVGPWQHTYNRVGRESSRGADYEAFKQQHTTRLLQTINEQFPEIVNNVTACYASTPLTNRDYIGDETGSMYGIEKDFNNPQKTVISPRTKIPNLFLTGQNLNLHGILGTSLSAVLTCCMLLKDDTLVDKIRNA